MTPDLPPPPSSSLDPSQPSSTGMQPNVAAGLAFLFSWLGGLIFLLLEKQSQWVRFWAAQALVVGIGVVALSIVIQILVRIPGLGVLIALLSMFLWLGVLVFVIYGAIQAFTGKTWEIPVVAPYARTLMTKIGG